VIHPGRPIPSYQISPKTPSIFRIDVCCQIITFFVINLLALGITALATAVFIFYLCIFKKYLGFLSDLVMGFSEETISLFAEASVFQTISVA